MLSVERNEYKMTINFEETELRLGLPGGSKTTNNDDQMSKNNNGKRGFIETENNNNETSVDLKLNLSTTSTCVVAAANNKQPKDSKVIEVSSPVAVAVAAAVNNSGDNQQKLKEKVVAPTTKPADPAKPPAAKAQVVGWPPVRSFRKNIVALQKKSTEEQADQKTHVNSNNVTSAAAFVKVSMDGAPYLRKVDLKLYKSYQDLSDAIGKMFSSFTIGNCGSQGMKDFMNESKLIDLLNGSEYVATYEDKDGDWMLVGDVPWEMFVNSCKRLRIMKGSEAIGLAPRAVEKCKSRS